MVAHIVLFRPKGTLASDARRAVVDALERALNGISSIKSARVGRRIIMNRPYDQANAMEFPYAAVLEFETEADLRAYLDHPAHEALGAQFYLTSEAALALDFEWVSTSALLD